MASPNPLEAIEYVEHYVSKWKTNITKAHTAYVHAGCMCKHREGIQKYQTQLEGVRAWYDELLIYCTEAQKDVNEAAVALHQAKKHHEDVAHNHNQTEKRMVKQMRDVTLQTLGRDLFVRHVVRAQKKHKVCALARITAGYGADYRFELEKRATKELTEKFFNSGGELQTAKRKLESEERRWKKARQNASLIAQIQRDSSAGKSALDTFLVEEDERGVKLWEDLVEEEKAKVAGQGLELLICQACRGWRWHPAKASLLA